MTTPHSLGRWFIATALVVASCSRGPAPSPAGPTASAGAAALDGGLVSASAVGDVKVGTGPLEIVRLRMDRQTSSGASVLRQYADPGRTYAMSVGETIELWAEYPAEVAGPRFKVEWGDGAIDTTGCGSCLLKHSYATAGSYTVKASLDDRISTTATRTFFLDSRAGEASAAPTTPAKHLTQNTNAVAITAGSVYCNAGGFHTTNRFLRRFFLDTDHGVTTQFNVTSVDIGVELAQGTGGSQPIEIRLYSIPKASPLLFANLTSIGNLPTAIPDTSLAVVNFPVTGSLVSPTTTDLVVELFMPDGRAPANNRFNPGSNSLGQSHPTYLAAVDCGVPNPTDMAALGFPNMHMVMVVNGN